MLILMLLPILISMNPPGASHGSQNISEEIDYLFSDLTPDNLGVKESRTAEQSNNLFNKNEEVEFSQTDSLESSNNNNSPMQ